MKISLLFLVGLAVLALFLVSCQEGAVAGEAIKVKCPSGCDLNLRITALESDVAELRAQLADLRGETRLARSEEYTRCLAEQTGCGTEPISPPGPFGGCPRGVTASACNADGSLRCTGEGEFYIDGPVDICRESRSCVGESPSARC